MAIFNFRKKTETSIVEDTSFPTSMSVQKQKKELNKDVKDEFDYQPYVNPLIKVFGVFVNGQSNLFPNWLNYIIKKSPLHGRILKFKRQLTVGNGYTYDDSSLDMNTKIVLNQILVQFDKYMDDIADNYWISSNVYLKVCWNKDFTKPISIKSIPHERVRIKEGVFESDGTFVPTVYEISADWANVARFPRYEIAAFDQSNKNDQEQLFQFSLRSEGQIIYNVPQYVSAVDWVNINGMVGEWHQANMENSVNPSGLLEFFKKPATEQEEWKIMDSINQSFAGAKKAGRLMFLFNKDVPSAAKYTPLDANKLDKTFIVLGDSIERSIAYAHGIDPQILGLKTPGSLGNSLSLPESYKIFNFAEIKPAQRDLEGIVNSFLSICHIPVKIKFNTSDDLFEGKDAQTDARVTLFEIQSLLEIQSSVAAGTTSYESALAILKNIFGYTDAMASAILGKPKDSQPISAPAKPKI